MTKLEKSIRHEMSFYGPRLRAGGHYYVHGMTGDMPKVGYVSKVCMDISDGICKNITVYTVGDAMDPDHYYGRCSVVTDAVCDFITGDTDWDGMINSIVNTALEDTNLELEEQM